MSRPTSVPVSVARSYAWIAELKEDYFRALCSCAPGCSVQECGQVAWFPQLASGFGFADINSQIRPAVNCSVVAPWNHLLKAKMEMFKIHIWTSVMFKVLWRNRNIGSLLCRNVTDVTPKAILSFGCKVILLPFLCKLQEFCVPKVHWPGTI